MTVIMQIYAHVAVLAKITIQKLCTAMSIFCSDLLADTFDCSKAIE